MLNYTATVCVGGNDFEATIDYEFDLIECQFNGDDFDPHSFFIDVGHGLNVDIQPLSEIIRRKAQSHLQDNYGSWSAYVKECVGAEKADEDRECE